MENAVMATEMLANLGIFLGAIGILWFVTVYRDKDKQNRELASQSHLPQVEVSIGDCECLLTNPQIYRVFNLDEDNYCWIIIVAIYLNFIASKDCVW